MSQKSQKRTQILNSWWVVQLKPSGVIVNRTFERAIDAWNWAEWNYKGRDGWRLRIESEWKTLTPDQLNNEAKKKRPYSQSWYVSKV